jgi:hypothetical protein
MKQPSIDFLILSIHGLTFFVSTKDITIGKLQYSRLSQNNIRSFGGIILETYKDRILCSYYQRRIGIDS